MGQIAVRLPEPLEKELDALVSAGAYATRAEAVRAGIEQLLDRHRRRAIGAAIAEGYQRMPQTDADEAAARTAALRSIAEEPWDAPW